MIFIPRLTTIVNYTPSLILNLFFCFKLGLFKLSSQLKILLTLFFFKKLITDLPVKPNP